MKINAVTCSKCKRSMDIVEPQNYGESGPEHAYGCPAVGVLTIAASDLAKNPPPDGERLTVNGIEFPYVWRSGRLVLDSPLT